MQSNKPNLSKELIKNLMKDTQQKQETTRRKLRAHQENKPTVQAIHITKTGKYEFKMNRRRNNDLDPINNSSDMQSLRHNMRKPFKRRHKPVNMSAEPMDLHNRSVDEDAINVVDQIVRSQN
jgi:hypothetical protein